MPPPALAWIHSPELAMRVQHLGEFIRYDTAFGPALMEIAVLVTAIHWRSHYEWWAHRRLAETAGLDAAIINAIRDAKPLPKVEEKVQVLYDYAKSLHETRNVPMDLHNRMLAAWGPRGVAEIIAAFSVKTWGKFLLWMLLGVLYVAAGMIAIMNPLLAAAYLTLMLGFALVFGGVLRIFLAFQMKSAGGPWGWVVLSGLITLLLGAMIIAQWPASSLFVLGVFLGIDLIFIGAGWITMGLALKKRA